MVEHDRGLLYPYGENGVYAKIYGDARILSFESGSPVDRYTTNGKTPTIKSTLYTEPFEVKLGTIVKAIIFEGYNPDGGSSLIRTLNE